MPTNYKKIEKRERFVTIKFQTFLDWNQLENKVDEFLEKVAVKDNITEVREFASSIEQSKDKDVVREKSM